MGKLSSYVTASALTGAEVIPIVQGGSNKKATISQIQPFVNVKWYGVKGDGIIDDTSAIQAVLTAEEGKIILIPDGTYLISNSLSIGTGTKIIGGMNCILQAIEPFTGESLITNPIIETKAFNFNTVINGITFRGIKTNTTIYGWHGVAGSHNNTIKGCSFINFGTTTAGAVDPSSSYCNLITQNLFDNCSVGVYLTGTNTQYGNIITNNRIFGCNEGVKGEWPFNTIISNNFIEAGRTGIHIIGSYNSIGNIVIQGNFIRTTIVDDGATYGISLMSGSDQWGYNRNCLISGNIIQIDTSIGGSAIQGLGSATQYNGNNVCCNNIITTNGDVKGILLKYSKYWTISGNKVIGDTSNYNILMDTDVKFCKVVNNSFGSAQSAIFLYGGIESNIFKDNSLLAGNIYMDATAPLPVSNLFESNILGALSVITDTGKNIYKSNRYITGSPIADRLNVIATAGGLTTGVLSSIRDINVTSASANNIVALPVCETGIIGSVITGIVGANGFELRVNAAQLTTVYINGVTTNVEAAIPASTTFEITCIDATHWILTAKTSLGAVITAIVPDAV